MTPETTGCGRHHDGERAGRATPVGRAPTLRTRDTTEPRRGPMTVAKVIRYQTRPEMR